MKNIFQYATALSLVIGSFSSCKPKEVEIEVIKEVKSEKDAPTQYEFESRFSDGVSSVDYGGQTVRQLLVQDIKTIISDATNVVGKKVKVDVIALLNRTDADGKSTFTSAGSFTLLKNKYSSIATGKNLYGKMSTASVISYNTTAQDLIEGWLEAIDARVDAGKIGKAIYISDDFLDYNQLINKTLTGSVIYSQGTSNYLNKVLTQDNKVAKGDKPYTAMERTWDEAFGYFGASRNYADYTDAELKSLRYKDANNDGKIDFRSEYNFSLSTNAGKRDLGAAVDPNFSKEAFDLFLSGRTAITNQKSIAQITPYVKNTAIVWEKIIAATVVHYLREITDDLNESSIDTDNLAKHFSEGKGFLIALQYGGNYKLINDSDLQSLHNLMGQNPSAGIVDATAISQYKSDLAEAKNILRRIYNFKQDNIDVWRH